MNPAAMLPHRPPFLFVSSVVEVHPGRAEAEWRVTGTEDFLRGHFPGRPLVPGVLLGEALAQTAGLALAGEPSRGEGAGGRAQHDEAPGTTDGGMRAPAPMGMLAQLDLRFRSAAEPPCVITLRAQGIGCIGSLHRFEVTALVGDRCVATGTLALSVPDRA